jgi:hypothetical protein
MKKPGREISILRRLIVTINSPCHRNSEKNERLIEPAAQRLHPRLPYSRELLAELDRLIA